MLTECNTREFDFQGLGSRTVTARFDGGAITSDAGGLLLREVEAKAGIIRRFAACFAGHGITDSGPANETFLRPMVLTVCAVGWKTPKNARRRCLRLPPTVAS